MSERARRPPTLRTIDVGPGDVARVEALFGPRGACGGCWCMYWRQARGERWDALKGEVAHRRLRSMIEGGAAHGVLALAGDRPVGWCAYDRKADLAKLVRSPTLGDRAVPPPAGGGRAGPAEVWSLPCFFVAAGSRGQGVGRALLAAALAALRRRGARLVEGYPVRPQGRIGAAFAWTGTLSMFERAGFAAVGRPAPGAGKIVVRRALRPSRGAR